MNEIRDYLKGGSRDFDRGYALLCKYCRQPSLLSWVGRKRDMQMLLYNLEKLQDAKPRPEYAAAADRTRYYRPAHTERRRQEKPETPAASPDTPRHAVRIFDPARISRDDLPEDLRTLYDLNGDDYRLLRSLHEKMKLAQDDETRATLREDVMAAERRIHERWNTIDRALAPGGDRRKDINVSTHRAYISKLLRRDTISESQKYELQQRVRELLEAGEEIQEKTLVRLREKGIKV